MINLLQQPVTRNELVAILKNCPAIPLLPSMTDVAWKNVARKSSVQLWLKKLSEMALLEADQPLPVLTDELYEDFSITGIRINFERPYFERRRRLARAAIAVLTMPNAGPLLKQSLLAKVQDIFDEISWALPAHVPNPRGQDPMCMDLFACETANLFGELLNIFGDMLPAGLKSEIRWRLRTQFFENYLQANTWWMTGTNNWNSVCHQGVLGAALALENDVDLLADMLLKMRGLLPNFLHGLGADGGTTEGPGYWSYGFGWFAILNEQLEKRTRGELSNIQGDSLVAAAARFGPLGLLEGSNLLNFSDCPPDGSLRASTVQYLATRLNDPALEQTAKVCWIQTLSKFGDMSAERADLLFFTRMLLQSPDAVPSPEVLPLQDVWLPDTQWMLTRSCDLGGRVWEFAAKAGHNNEHHNHNDVGSYILNVNGTRIVSEIGAPEYTREFFSDKRYTFLAARSLGHSVPLVNGVEQAAGEAYRGTVVRQLFTDKQAELVTDLTAVYPAEAHLKKLVRTCTFEKQSGTLHVSDSYELNNDGGTIETAVMTEVEPVVQNDGMVLEVAGKKYLIQPLKETRIAGVHKHVYHMHNGNEGTIFRIALTPLDAARSGKLAYDISAI